MGSGHKDRNSFPLGDVLPRPDLNCLILKKPTKQEGGNRSWLNRFYNPNLLLLPGGSRSEEAVLGKDSF